MKKISFTPVLLVLLGLASCATIPPKTEASEVFDAENVSAMELFARAQTWLIKVIDNANATVQYAGAGKILNTEVGRQITGEYYTFVDTGKDSGYIVKTTVSVESKDGKIRISCRATNGRAANQYRYPVGQIETTLPKNVYYKMSPHWEQLIHDFKNNLGLNW